jgi:hypothetical protein
MDRPRDRDDQEAERGQRSHDCDDNTGIVEQNVDRTHRDEQTRDNQVDERHAGGMPTRKASAHTTVLNA